LASVTETIPENEYNAFCALINKRREGVCAAYLTGKKEFMGLEFTVNNSTLVPRPDTETLVEAALEMCSAKCRMTKEITVLDLCTGSGAVAIALKHQMPELEVFASDICQETLETAKANASRLLPDNSIRFFSGDLYSAFVTAQSAFNIPQYQFTLITANPPYIPSKEIDTLPAEVRNEPRIALDGGRSGLEIIKRIINEAPLYLQNSGSLLLEADPRQMEEISVLLKTNGFINIKTYKDLAGENRVIGGRHEK
jgi:release factor glutamine methyltransferase